MSKPNHKWSWGEEDLFTAKSWYCYLNNHNKARKKIKRLNSKKTRRVENMRVRKEIDEVDE